MMLFDSHTHLNFPEFKDSYKQIIADCLEKGIGIVNVGADYESSRRAVEIAREYPNDQIYATIGLHPTEGEGIFEQDKFQKMIDEDVDKKIIGVGEIGLEYFQQTINNQQLTVDINAQKELFVKQLQFAEKNNLPMVLHARGSKDNPDDAFLDMIEILRARGRDEAVPRLYDTGVVHCFTASVNIASKFLDLGFYIGFTGIITFKNKSVEPIRESVKSVPLDRILVETDAPWLTPEPHRGEKNTPQYVEFVARKVAELKDASYEEICEKTTENFKRLF